MSKPESQPGRVNHHLEIYYPGDIAMETILSQTSTLLTTVCLAVEGKFKSRLKILHTYSVKLNVYFAVIVQLSQLQRKIFHHSLSILQSFCLSGDFVILSTKL